MTCDKVLIVGGGPAGSYCGLSLAERGIYPTILDHSHPREKPCGGGLTVTAIEKFPFLNSYRKEGNDSEKLEIITPSGKRIEGERKGFNISRQFLDKEILNTAVKKGAKLIEEKVIAIGYSNDCWKIKTKKQSLSAKILVGADGVLSIARKRLIGPITHENLNLTFGYMVTGVEHYPTTIQYLPMRELKGYIWVFPRKNQTSIGIIGPMQSGRVLRQLMDSFLMRWRKIEIKSQFAALIPCAKNPDFFSLPCSGKNWLLIGDAAGHVDPINGEGILYALWSGQLAAKAITAKNLRLYDRLWRKEYGDYLKSRSIERESFFNPLSLELKAMLAIKQKTKMMF